MASKKKGITSEIGTEIEEGIEGIKTEIKKDNILAVIAVLTLIGLIIALNTFSTVKVGALAKQAIANAALSTTGNAVSSAQQTQLSSVIPTGVPAIYGEELQIAYDDISASNQQKADATINKLAKFDTSITLTGDKLERYITIASSISCEYCCGAKALIFSNGQAACGCAHSYAMRGLGKYLLQNHADEYTDLQILEELGKWKVLFFPDIHMQKAQILQQQGIELNYVNLASNKYRGIEQGSSGGGSMVGGC